MNRVYRLHGLHFRSGIPFGTECPGVSPIDAIALQAQSGASFEAIPTGIRVLSRYEFPDGATCSHVEDAKGFLTTYFDKAQFRLTPDRALLHVRLATDLEADWIKIFMAASYPAFLLYLQGRVPLHASAVWLPAQGGAVGFLATPGGGKSTLAGALCLAGGRLISDDLLSLEADKAAPCCETGSRQLRLRQPSAELAERFGGQRVSASPDGRSVVDAAEDLPASLPLSALFQPVLDRQAAGIRLEKLSATEAFQAVARDPRVKGLAEPAWIRAAFEHAGRLARDVPIYRVTVPWRERNFTELGRNLAEAIGKI